jgi:rare lipoprotein A
MRSSVCLAAAMVLASAIPSSASTWQCQGSAYVCGEPSRASGKTASYGKNAKRAYSAENSSSGETSGKASYYWQGTRTASGARFNPGGLTAAHRTLPFGTRVMVTNRVNGKSVVVTINDRGPFIKGRIIDLSRGAAQAISMTGMGVAPVSIQVLGRG